MLTSALVQCSYLSGNFAPINRTLPLTPCSYEGDIPEELLGGQYIRNGGNPVTNHDLGRDAHWFDGDGMLSGVYFRRLEGHKARAQPCFVNQYVLTDLYLSTVTTPSLRAPVMPSIATLVNPLSSVLTIVGRIFRTILLVMLSHLWGSQQAIKKISVANTSILYHDGRALATCESGPPMRMALPGLQTVGWFNGRAAEGEPGPDPTASGFGGSGVLSFMKEWTTAHVSGIFCRRLWLCADLMQPRVDPLTEELILFHANFIPPYIYYSVVPNTSLGNPGDSSHILGAPVPGVSGSKMMHDFGVSLAHTVIIDLPLSLDISNLARNRAVLSYDPCAETRFGIFPRRHPERVRWVGTKACCIFHTANTWDEISIVHSQPKATAVSMLACRLTSAAIVFATGGIVVPTTLRSTVDMEDDQSTLYYFHFDISDDVKTTITHQWALSAIPFDFPAVRDDVAMQKARYIFGCSSSINFNASLGRAVKIDALVKMDVLELIERGVQTSPSPITGCVDKRSVAEVLAADDPDDPIKVFQMPPGWYAQEARFVPRNHGAGEDDGWVLTYAFDESQLDAAGNVTDGARSEMWIIDARDMRSVVARVYLPQRVPYGLHASWFSEQRIKSQRPIQTVRSPPSTLQRNPVGNSSLGAGFWSAWMGIRLSVLRLLG